MVVMMRMMKYWCWESGHVCSVTGTVRTRTRWDHTGGYTTFGNAQRAVTKCSPHIPITSRNVAISPSKSVINVSSRPMTQQDWGSTNLTTTQIHSNVQVVIKDSNLRTSWRGMNFQFTTRNFSVRIATRLSRSAPTETDTFRHGSISIVYNCITLY